MGVSLPREQLRLRVIKMATSGPQTLAQKAVVRNNAAKARAAKELKRQQRGLTDQMAVFVEAYMAGGSATAAARTAGYKIPSAAAGALLNKPLIKEALANRREQLMKTLVASPERVVAEHVAVGFSDIVSHILALEGVDQRAALEKLSADDRHAIKDVSFDPETGRVVKLSLHAKGPSLSSLQSILGMDQAANVNVQTAISVTLARDIVEAAYRVLPDSETKQIENQTDAAFDLEAARKLLGEK